MEEAVSIIPATPYRVNAPDRQGDYIDAMIEAARLAQKTGWGADGDIAGVGEGEAIRSQRFWVDPNFPIHFSEEDLEIARRSLVSTGQQTPFRVVKLPNPEAVKRSHDGTTDQDLLIVDIDGALLFKAAARTSLDQFRARIESYEGSYYKLLLRMMHAKAQQHRLRRVEKGQTYLRAKAAYDAEQAWRTQHGERPLGRFPTYKELAPQVGCASEADFSLCVAMAGHDEEIIQLAEAGTLTEDNLRELASVPTDKRLPAAQQIVQRQEQAGRALPRADVRDTLRLVTDRPTRTPRPVGTVRWEGMTHQVPLRTLWTVQTVDVEAQQEIPVPVALGRLMHDVDVCLSESAAEFPREAQPLIKKLRQVLSDPTIQSLIASVNPDEVMTTGAPMVDAEPEQDAMTG